LNEEQRRLLAAARDDISVRGFEQPYWEELLRKLGAAETSETTEKKGG